MDLVSSTLDKYLKHRFNGTAPTSQPPASGVAALVTKTIPTTINPVSPLAPNDVPRNGSNTDAVTQPNNVAEKEANLSTTDNGQAEPIACETEDMDDSTSDICEPIEVHTLSFQKMVPCCVALHPKLSYIAAGFENSQIYLWTVIPDESVDLVDNHQNHHNHYQPQQQNPPKDPTSEEGMEGIESEPSQASVALQCQRGGSEGHRLGDVSRLTAHSGSIYSIEFVQDIDLMLSCSEDTTIRLWCIKSKCNLTVYRGHNYPVWSLAVSPRGQYFASASMDTTARLWSLDRMCPLRIFCGHEDDVECVQFHPNGKYLATGSADCTVRLWTVADGRMVRLMVGHQSSITSLSFFPNGKFLASSSCDGSVRVWNLATNCITIDQMVPAFRSLAFDAAQEFAATCGADNVLRIWHVGNSSIVQKRALELGDKFTQLIHSHFHAIGKLFIVGLARVGRAPTK